MINKVKIYFEKVQNYLHRDFGVQLRKELLSKSVGSIDNKKILDIGCGNGNITLPYIENNQITFLDFSIPMLQLVEKSIPLEYIDNAKILNCDFIELSKTEKFDFVFFIGVIAHAPKSVKENLFFLKDLVSPNGTLYFQFSNYGHWITRLELLIRKKNYEINLLSKSEFLNLCNELGLTVKEEIRYATILPGMGRLSNEFLYKYVSIVTKSKFLSFLKSEYIFRLEVK